MIFTYIFARSPNYGLTNCAFGGNIYRQSTRLWKTNMGVFPSGQWGQTVNLLLSASVVRIHPRPPNKKNPNLFLIGDGFGFFVFFGYSNEGSRGRRKTPIPCHRP